MQIYDAAGTASALYDLVTHNRLAWQLAQAWDKQHPDDMPIVKACEKLRDDWDKMVWFTRYLGFTHVAGPIGVLAILFIVILTVSNIAIALIAWVIPSAVIIALTVTVKRALEKRIQSYCRLGIPLHNVNSKIHTVNDHYKCFGDAHDLVKRLDDMCFAIVRIEMLGQEDVKFLNPFPLAYDYVVRPIDLKALRNNFREQVAELAPFGLATTDLSVHFEAARARWDKLAAEGYQMTDFQI